MTAPLSDEVQWATNVGSRLRLLQASFADDESAVRRDYLAEEIEREIREIPDSRRKTYLEALAERFPQGESVSIPTPAAAPAEMSPESLVAQLSALAPTLSESQRRELSYRLQDAGFAVAVPVASAGETDEIPPELQKKLALDASQTLDRKRALRLVAVLIDLVVTMDQVAWQVWKNLAPNSRVRREGGATGDLRKMAGPYLTGDTEVNYAQVAQLLDRTRQLVAGLLAAVGATGDAFSKQYLSRFSPQSIKEAAEKDGGFFVGPEQRCWRKYTQLFSEVTGATIESEIAAAIVNYTEDLILGPSRTQGGG